MHITLPQLPFAMDALEPHISKQTVETHYSKHHKGYVDKTNDKIDDFDKAAQLSLEDLIHFANKNSDRKDLFNVAAQIWNHNIYWQSLSPDGGGKPSGPFSEALNKSFGSFDAFSEKFKKVATSEFGSGWAWLTAGKEGLRVRSTHDAECPLVDGETVLVCCDVWEHAYYLDYKNERQRYVDIFLNHLVNWSFAEEQWLTEK
ncbi:MAG: superoxide dismutase [Rhodospirillaceae bacterium]